MNQPWIYKYSPSRSPLPPPSPPDSSGSSQCTRRKHLSLSAFLYQSKLFEWSRKKTWAQEVLSRQTRVSTWICIFVIFLLKGKFELWIARRGLLWCVHSISSFSFIFLSIISLQNFSRSNSLLFSEIPSISSVWALTDLWENLPLTLSPATPCFWEDSRKLPEHKKTAMLSPLWVFSLLRMHWFEQFHRSAY